MAASIDEQRASIAMREIGHEVLMAYGDSTSRVLPIECDQDRYTISFSSTFAFDPGKVSAIVDSLLMRRQLAEACLVEVTACQTNAVVHSFEINFLDKNRPVACNGRTNPEDCYQLHITLTTAAELSGFNRMQSDGAAGTPLRQNALEIDPRLWWLAIGGALFSATFYLTWKRSTRIQSKDAQLIKIGQSRYDKNSRRFISKNLVQPLSSKEAKLLLALYQSKNAVISREKLLQQVWDDEGDYVGRTLDVFISKLRKKLEADPSLQISTERGVGYRLVVS